VKEEDHDCIQALKKGLRECKKRQNRIILDYGLDAETLSVKCKQGHQMEVIYGKVLGAKLNNTCEFCSTNDHHLKNYSYYCSQCNKG
jgi:hypothetical protein